MIIGALRKQPSITETRKREKRAKAKNTHLPEKKKKKQTQKKNNQATRRRASKKKRRNKAPRGRLAAKKSVQGSQISKRGRKGRGVGRKNMRGAKTLKGQGWSYPGGNKGGGGGGGGGGGRKKGVSVRDDKGQRRQD